MSVNSEPIYEDELRKSTIFNGYVGKKLVLIGLPPVHPSLQLLVSLLKEIVVGKCYSYNDEIYYD